MHDVIRPMTAADAQAVAAWRYEGEYAFYDADADEEDFKDLLDPASWGTKYYAADGRDGTLADFFAFDVRGAVAGVGLGLRPDLTGRGLGEEYLAAGPRFATERFFTRVFTLTVAAFNARAIRVYERAGFREVARYRQPANGGLHSFVRMARDPVRLEELTSAEIGALPELGVTAYTDLAGMIEAWEEIVVGSGGPAGHVGGHADIAESSMILALRPEPVRTELAAAGYTGDPKAVLGTIFEAGFKAVTANGVIGDPAGMSAPLGRALLDGMATRIAAAL